LLQSTVALDAKCPATLAIMEYAASWMLLGKRAHKIVAYPVRGLGRQGLGVDGWYTGKMHLKGALVWCVGRPLMSGQGFAAGRGGGGGGGGGRGGGGRAPLG
jgi:hypothetical protein